MDNMNGSAYPTQVNGGDFYGGLTKLEYAAIQAMKGYLANPSTPFSSHSDEMRINFYIQEAKRLFKALEKAHE